MTLSALDRSAFTDKDWMAYLEDRPHPDIMKWITGIGARGQEYYLRRIDRLSLRGGKVLDAGCGIGNWAMALAHRFEEVQAMEISETFLEILSGVKTHFGGRIHTKSGSVEAIPYDDNSFDTVFCNGVIFLTAVETSLSEFARVLRPGGQLYVTYNGPGWWRHLINDRGPTEPNCIRFGADGLINWAFRLLDEIGLEKLVSEADREKGRALRASAGGSLETIEFARNVLSGLPLNGHYYRKRDDVLACCVDLTANEIDPVYAERLAADLLSRICDARPAYELLVHTYTYRPEEMSEALSRHGFLDILASREGTITLNEDAPAVSPIYTAHQDVHECLCWKLG